MLQERIDAVRLPKNLLNEIDDLVRALNAAEEPEMIKREGAMQVAFILGLEKAKRLRATDIEALYMMFDDAVEAKLQDASERL